MLTCPWSGFSLTSLSLGYWSVSHHSACWITRWTMTTILCINMERWAENSLLSDSSLIFHPETSSFLKRKVTDFALYARDMSHPWTNTVRNATSAHPRTAENGSTAQPVWNVWNRPGSTARPVAVVPCQTTHVPPVKGRRAALTAEAQSTNVKTALSNTHTGSTDIGPKPKLEEKKDPPSPSSDLKQRGSLVQLAEQSCSLESLCDYSSQAVPSQLCNPKQYFFPFQHDFFGSGLKCCNRIRLEGRVWFVLFFKCWTDK